MELYLLFILALTLSMDAFAVSITNGMAMGINRNNKITFQVAFSFGLAQALMPVIGYFAGRIFSSYIKEFDHWIAFILLSIIGVKMIYDAVCEMKNNEEAVSHTKISGATIIVQSVATSIDALAVGISFALLDVNIVYSAVMIGIITFTMCILGGFIGNKVGGALKGKATVIGGVVLIAIGINILVEHMFLS